MIRPLIAAAVLPAVIIGGLFTGATRGLTDEQDRPGEDLVVAVAIYWSAVGVLSVIAWASLRWLK